MERIVEFDYMDAIREIKEGNNQEEAVYDLMGDLNNKQRKEIALEFVHPDDFVEESREQIIARHLYELKVFGTFTKDDLDKIWESI